MQGNSTKSKTLVFTLFLLLTFSQLALATAVQQPTMQQPAVQTLQPIIQVQQPVDQRSMIQQSATRLNINQASLEQLSTLPGIGPTKASAIILVREQKGSFANLSDLQAVKGIGARTTARLEHLISF